MARPKGTKNVMRSPEEKEAIVLEAIEYGICKTASKYDVARRLLQKWIIKYNKGGLEALKSNTGKKSGNGKGRPTKPKTREEASTTCKSRTSSVAASPSSKTARGLLRQVR